MFLSVVSLPKTVPKLFMGKFSVIQVVYDHSQFGLLNNQEDDSSTTPVLMESKHKPRRRKWGKLLRTAALCGAYVSLVDF